MGPAAPNNGTVLLGGPAAHPDTLSIVLQVLHPSTNESQSLVAQVGLLDQLTRIMPEELTRLCLSTATPRRWRMPSRTPPGRQNIIAFDGGYHGRTYGAMALTTSYNATAPGMGR